MVFRIAPGRRLRWSPAWPGEDARVLFDSASGDFWVVSGSARELLQHLQSGDNTEAEALVAGRPSEAEALRDTLASLVECGVLATAPAAEGTAAG